MEERQGGRARRHFIHHWAVQRETNFMDLDCYLLCIAQNPDAVQPGTPHGPVCLLIATLIGELSNTKPNALQLQTTVAKVWSRNTRQFFTWSLVGWVGHTAGATQLPHPGHLRKFLTVSHIFSSIPGDALPWQSYCRRTGFPCRGELNVKHSVGKSMLKAIYWGYFSSLVQMSSLVWLCPLLLISNGRQYLNLAS